MSKPILIQELVFDDDNLSELEAHSVTLDQVEAVRAGQPKFFPNKRGRSGTYLMIGPDGSGAFLSVPIMETPVRGIWRPITAWHSSKAQKTKWRQAK